jgi:hypothetical protein
MSEVPTQTFWRKCSSCKTPIAFNQVYWICSISSCNYQRTGLVFCKVSCFDAHVPMLNHKNAGAYEKRAPTLAQWQKEQTPPSARPKEASPQLAAKPSHTGTVPREILVVVSKTKDYVRTKTGLNTSDGVMELLSDRLRGILDEASKRAVQDGRKTLMERDF